MYKPNLFPLAFLAVAVWALFTVDATAAPTRVEIVPDSSITCSDPQNCSFDFGTANLLDEDHIDKVFTLKNVSDTTIKVAKLQPSCGCTTANIVGGDPLLAPGKTVEIHVTVDFKHLMPGAIYKSVVVFTSDSDNASIILAMRGTISTGVLFSPSNIDFEQPQFGQTRKLAVALSVDSRLLGNQKDLPSLISSNPYVQVTAVSGPTKTTTDPSRPQSVERAYDIVLLPNAPIGLVDGTLSFGSAPTKAETKSVWNKTITGSSVSLSGEVMGDYMAIPGSLVFGSVSFASEETRDVLIASKKASKADIINTESSSNWVSATPVSSATEALTRTSLRLTVKPGAPFGELKARITIEMSDHERLSIPVEAYVRN